MFWSLYHGQGATTANLTAISAKIALETDNRALVMHNQLTHNMLENYFKLTKESFDPNKGVDPALRELKNRNLKSEEIGRYAVSLLTEGRLDVLMGSTYDEQAQDTNIHHIFRSLYNHATQYYSLVYVDAHAGVTESAENLMEQSDLVVININQNHFLLEATKIFMEKASLDPLKCLFLLGSYQVDNKLTLKNIKRRYGFKNIIALPYCTNFAESLNNQRVIDFIHKNSEVKEYDDNFAFMMALAEVKEFILIAGEGKMVKGH